VNASKEDRSDPMAARHGGREARPSNGSRVNEVREPGKPVQVVRVVENISRPGPSRDFYPSITPESDGHEWGPVWDDGTGSLGPRGNRRPGDLNISGSISIFSGSDSRRPSATRSGGRVAYGLSSPTIALSNRSVCGRGRRPAGRHLDRGGVPRVGGRTYRGAGIEAHVSLFCHTINTIYLSILGNIAESGCVNRTAMGRAATRSGEDGRTKSGVRNDATWGFSSRAIVARRCPN
jgi:hypothetical protein